MTEVRPLDARSLLAALVEGGVQFIIVGGLALGAHGHPRGTRDVDIVPAPTPDNLERFADVLQKLDYEIVGTEEFESEELVQPDVEGLLGGGNWVLHTRYGRLDILQHVEPEIDYEALDSEAIEDEVFGQRVRFCGYRHLVAMKEAADRPQDRADLERLRAVRGEG